MTLLFILQGILDVLMIASICMVWMRMDKISKTVDKIISKITNKTLDTLFSQVKVKEQEEDDIEKIEVDKW